MEIPQVRVVDSGAFVVPTLNGRRAECHGETQQGGHVCFFEGQKQSLRWGNVLPLQFSAKERLVLIRTVKVPLLGEETAVSRIKMTALFFVPKLKMNCVYIFLTCVLLCS